MAKTYVHGLQELEQAIIELRGEMGGKADKILALAIRKAGKDTVLLAQQMAAARHQDTGALFRSLKIVRHPKPRYLAELYGVGVHNMGKRPPKGQPVDPNRLPWYAQIVEYGGRNYSHPLRGFMRQSLENNQDRYLALLKADAGRRIDLAAKKIGNNNLRAVAAKVRA